jgi:hypothetical protein
MMEPPVHRTSVKSSAGNSIERTGLILALFVTITAAGALLRMHAVDSVRQPGPDAFHYARQAEIMLSQGNAGLRMEA